MSPSQKSARQARERVAAMREAERRRERLKKILTVSLAVVATAGVIGGLTYLIRDSTKSEPAAPLTAGVKTFSGLTQNHVSGKVNYPQSPPVGGDHHATWQNCGTYATPLENEKAVHSLEHGAVWVTYKPDLPSAQVDELKKLVKGKPYVLLSPYEGLSASVVASAWGKQLVPDSASDPKIASFITENAQSPKAPEPGAPCTNGVGEPTA